MRWTGPCLLSLALWLNGLVGGAAPRPAQSNNPAAGRPNLVFILADDLGWRDTGLYGSTFLETPNIDRLAQRGMMFAQAYAAPLCSPTRASIMTGLHPARLGMTSASGHLPEEVLKQSLRVGAQPTHKARQADSVTRLSSDYFTLAEALKEAGYVTGHFGKWHLGRAPYDPRRRGFDVDVPHWFGPGPAGGYLAPWQFPNFQGEPGEHIEDRMAAEAEKFLRANKDRPFYLNYWAFSVHAPWGAKPSLIQKYRAKADPKNPQRNPVYGAMVQSLDEAVGRITRTIDELGLAERTILIFSSDNGGVHFRELDGAPMTSNAPLRAGKATVYEGGTRTPLVVIWPGVVRPGSRSDQLVSGVDFYPTILELVGRRPKAGQTFDGLSIIPALKGGTLPRDTVFCHFPHYTPATGNTPATYVRKGDWKLIRYYADNEDQTDRHELYNLKDDVGEADNLAGRRPDKVKELSERIDGFLRHTKAVVPKPNPDYQPPARR